MKYEINNITNEQVERDLLENLLKLVSKKLKINDGFVSIVLVDNQFIHNINKTYRGIDRETDVISFAFQDNEDIDNNSLGEIYISLEKAHSQSIEYNHSFERELCFLLVHGILHLMGYDHMKHDDEVKMFSLQEEILKEYKMER